MSVKVTGAELEIMRYLWQHPQNNTFAEMLAWFNEEKDKRWSKQTLNTNLLRLNKKGLIERMQGDPKSVYIPIMDEVHYQQICAKEVLEESYDGKLSNFIAALSGNQSITKEEEEELLRFIQMREKI